MCKCNEHGPQQDGGCHHSSPAGPKKPGLSRPPWRRFMSKDERKKALEKYREELEKELEAVKEKLEEQ